MSNLLTVAAISSAMLMPAPAVAAPYIQGNDLTSIFTIRVADHPAAILEPPKPKKDQETKKPAAPEKPKPVIYVVVEGDNLTKIGTAHNVEWQRLWAKNKQLDHPDRINVGDKITIPAANERLQREIPAAVSLPAITPGVSPQSAPVAAAAPNPAPASYGGGNTYSYGYCTWYVKNRRGASLPNGLGNANTWYSRAAAMGMAVGSTPQAGAVGTTTRGALGHVVYVESVNGDGTINISEMNAPTWGETTYRTAQASEFIYIY